MHHRWKSRQLRGVSPPPERNPKTESPQRSSPPAPGPEHQVGVTARGRSAVIAAGHCAIRPLGTGGRATSVAIARDTQDSTEGAGDTISIEAAIACARATTAVADGRRAATAAGAGTAYTVGASIAGNFTAGAGATTAVGATVAGNFPAGAGPTALN